MILHDIACHVVPLVIAELLVLLYLCIYGTLPNIVLHQCIECY